MQQSKNNYYEEGELWYILASVLQALNFLNSKLMWHGDIRPGTILLNNNGEIKLMPNNFLFTTK